MLVFLYLTRLKAREANQLRKEEYKYQKKAPNNTVYVPSFEIPAIIFICLESI